MLWRKALEDYLHSAWHPCGDWGTPFGNSQKFAPEAFGDSGQDLLGEEDSGRLYLLFQLDRDTSVRAGWTQTPEDAPTARAVDDQSVPSALPLLAEEQLEIECSVVGTHASGLPRALAFPFPNVG